MKLFSHGKKFRVCATLVFFVLLCGVAIYIALQKQQEVCFLDKQMKTVAEYARIDQDSLQVVCAKYDSLQLLYKESGELNEIYLHTLRSQALHYRARKESLQTFLDSLAADFIECMGVYTYLVQENESLKQEIKTWEIIFEAIEESSKILPLEPPEEKKEERKKGTHSNLG